MLESVTRRKDSTMYQPDTIFFVMNKIENIFLSEITGKSKQISKTLYISKSVIRHLETSTAMTKTSNDILLYLFQFFFFK